MIYLISQMVVALAVAIVLGAAIGWLVHRSSHSQDVNELKQALARQTTQLAQAQSEVDLVAADYKEFETRSHDKIAALQADAQTIPELASNLERAQLMVSQNMKKHESRERELTTQNQRLLAELEPYRQNEDPETPREVALKQERADNSGADEDPFDDVMEIGDELQLDLDHTDPAAHSEKLRQTWASSTSPKARTPMVDLSGNEPADDTTDIRTDGSADDSTLFQAVDQRDDLQQIFGIGPMTEKALNELGITSYSQLADLQQHDIQRIANALDIGATRIERDNWVGNARRQLEDVLEQL